MTNEELKAAYQWAKKKYAEIGVDTDKAIDQLSKIRISINCWQGDDVEGFLNKQSLSGGIQVTGNYPGKARTPDELRQDLDFLFTLLPGKYKLNLHAIYADTDEKVSLDKLEPRHFEKWVAWAKEKDLGLDFNPTCFSSPMVNNGFTLSSADEKTRHFWIDHCKACLKIGDYFGKELGQKCVANIWIPDGYKDTPIDYLAPRQRLEDSLDQILETPYDKKNELVAVEAKFFGIGVESYTTGSNEFYVGYATKHQIAVCLDAGHYHPNEFISDKISSVLLYTPELLLHVSRPVNWDSDHVVTFTDELQNIATSLVRNNLIERTHIGLDFFDATINRIAAWTIGTRNMLKALLKAYLEPTEELKEVENKGDFTTRLAVTEELKSYPFGIVFDYYCMKQGVPTGDAWLAKVRDYEKNVLSKRN